MIVDVSVDGVSSRSTIKAGATGSVGQCPATARICNVRVYSPTGENGQGTDYFVRQYNRTGTPPLGTPRSVDVYTGGAGYGPGFTQGDGSLAYANSSGNDITIIVDTGGTGDDQVIAVRAGARADLPLCDPAGRCNYAIGTGKYDPNNPDAFVLLRGITVSNGNVMYGGSSYDESDFQRVAGQIVYTNSQPSPVTVVFRDAGGQTVQVSVAAEDTIALPECAGPNNSCDYAVNGPNREMVAMMRVVNGDGESTGPVQTSPSSTPAQPGSSTPSNSGGGNTTPRGSSSGNGWSVPLSQFDFCAQIAGAAKATSSSQLGNVGYACSGVSLGTAAASGDWGSVAATALGLGAGALTSRAAYLPSLAINVWAYTIGQAAQADWSSAGSTANYAASNPGVVVQETVKAAGVVFSAIWPAFLPKW